MFINTEGIILRQTKYGESDKILTIFTKKNGKIQAIAKGARKPKSALIASAQVFCYSDFVFFKGKSFYHINNGEIISSFYALRENLSKLAYGTYIVELTEAGLNDEEPNEKLFQLLIKTLKILASIDDNFLKLVLAFKIKYISFIGYKPHLKDCIECGRSLGNRLKFSISHGGALCENCFSKDIYSEKIDIQTLRAMDKLLYSDLDELQNIEVEKDTLLKIEGVLIRYITSHIEKRNFKSLDFINTLNRT